jgi:mRNA-degrading endonuclease YafQ of YafQ-DinJ toxin-antitoxin module
MFKKFYRDFRERFKNLSKSLRRNNTVLETYIATYHVMLCDVFKIARICYSWHLINIASIRPDIRIVYYSFLVALKMQKSKPFMSSR